VIFPNILTLLLAAAVVFAAGAAGAWLFARQGRAHLGKEAASEISRSRQQVSDLQVEIARLEERSLAERRASEEMRASLPDTFKTLASQVLEQKSQEFANQNQTSLGQMLQPLKTKLEDFQQMHLEQVKDSATMRAQIANLFDSTNKVSEQANSLANALKGSSKTRGSWGELVLETILEGAGLRKGEEYEAQESYSAENGGRAQPDVVIHLPGGRHLIVDSKLSLIGYEAHCNAETGPARAAALGDHLNSMRAHIKGLADKNYQTLYGLKSLDFVIMFVPIEPAFMLALSGDEKLWQQAWQRNVLLVSPSTLLFVLRTVAYLWRQEQQERHAEEIARRGAELYNKLAGFVDSLTEVGDRLAQAQKSYDDAFSKLSTGRGNVIRQAEMLKALGVKPAKQLAQGLVEQSGQETLELRGSSEID
jgi:DNA recombination protein RmuC